MDFMWTILSYECQKKTEAALLNFLFLKLKVSVSQTVLWSLGIKEEESGVFTIESNIHLGVTDVLSAVKSSFSPGWCKYLERKAPQIEIHLQKVWEILL